MTGAEAIPATAWEQAAIIGIFIVFFGIMLGWFTRQSEKWQNFMLEIDEKWRVFNQSQREQNNCAMADVNSSLTNLAKTTSDLAHSVSELRKDIDEHDAQAKEILMMVNKPVPRTRTKKATPSGNEPG